MHDILLYGYYMLMVIAFIISISYKLPDSAKILSILLFISIITELIVEACKAYDIRYYLLYQIFTPIEYVLISMYFYKAIFDFAFKRYVKISMIVFVSICATETAINSNALEFPRLLCYIECFLIILTAVVALLLIDVDSSRPIYKIGDFWFSIAFLFFNSALFIVLFFDQQQSLEIRAIFSIINKSANCLLYVLLSVGFLCLERKR